MCYNYNNIRYDPEVGELVNKYKLRPSERSRLLSVEEWLKFKERFEFYYANGFDFKERPVITMDNPDEIQFFHWGLVPNWTKNKGQAEEIRKQTLNARSETVFTLPSFRGSILSKRCLIPATGFYEWHTKLGTKYPYHIMVKDDNDPSIHRDFCFGGIYSTWIDKAGGEVLNSFSIITTPANKLLELIHNTKKRMPLILHREDEQIWLMPELDKNHIQALMQPYPEKLMFAHSITKLITSSTNRNTPEVMVPHEYDGIAGWLNGGELSE